MNVHHLELFYFVARYGGISQAVRSIPYGIQQPAISGQMQLLEDELGVKLFNRRPFALTPPGEELYSFIQPFFSNLADVKATIKGESRHRLRLASSMTVLRDHVPAMLQDLKRQFPLVRPSLKDANQALAEELLHQQEIDLAITELAGRPAHGIHAEPLVTIPLQLLVHESSPFQTAEEVWLDGTTALISLPETETLTRLFQDELRRQKIHWPVTLQVSGLDLVESCVENGLV